MGLKSVAPEGARASTGLSRAMIGTSTPTVSVGSCGRLQSQRSIRQLSRRVATEIDSSLGMFANASSREMVANASSARRLITWNSTTSFRSPKAAATRSRTSNCFVGNAISRSRTTSSGFRNEPQTPMSRWISSNVANASTRRLASSARLFRLVTTACYSAAGSLFGSLSRASTFASSCWSPVAPSHFSSPAQNVRR
jgi:hypothetical protein